MCSVSEAGSYLRLIDFVYHSTLGLRVIKKREKDRAFVVGCTLRPCTQLWWLDAVFQTF